MDLIYARGRRESGQMLVLFVLALGVLMGMVAMSVDVGMILHERRSLQNAADAAALAAVQELPESSSAAVAAAQEWAANNGYASGYGDGDDDSQGDNDNQGDDGGVSGGATVTVNTPYQGNPSAVEVVIEVEQPFIFARALGLDTIDVSARAVASRDPAFGYAVFAHDEGCGGTGASEIDIAGSQINITGGIHSNGDLKTNASDVYVDGPITTLCEPAIRGGELTGTAGVTLTSEPRDWPVYYEYFDFGPCTFKSSGDLRITRLTTEYWLDDDPDTGILKPGVYCAEEDISINVGASGNVTFVAHRQLSFVGSSFDFQAYQNDVVAYTDYDPGNASKNAIHFGTSTVTWEGILLAPNGRVQISGSTATSPAGAVIGKTVKISASIVDITGLQFEDDGPPKLVE